MRATSIEVVPTGGPLGAEVSGVDLSRDPPPGTIAEIVGALARHLVLVFRSQELPKERLIDLAEWFGGCYRSSPDEPALGDVTLDPVLIVSNVHERGLLGSGPLVHHADQEFLREPSRATLLYAVEAPPSGGETSWSNLCDAYDELDERTKRRITHLERWSDNPYAGGRKGIRAVTGGNQRFTDRAVPVHAHPLVRTHPATGRKSLYVSGLTSGIRGVRGMFAAQRARWLLRRLKRHVDRPHLYWTHAWRPGDLAIWDNIFTNHKRAAFDPSRRRVMHRCQVVGSPPDPARPDTPASRLWRPEGR